jgi:hypothetical protein
MSHLDPTLLPIWWPGSRTSHRRKDILSHLHNITRSIPHMVTNLTNITPTAHIPTNHPHMIIIRDHMIIT